MSLNQETKTKNVWYFKALLPNRQLVQKQLD